MLTIGQTLSYYKRKDVERLLLEHAQDKEVAVRFNDYFGKRPDTLNYENDILEFAKKGATSFHCSEELWENPLQLGGNLKPSEVNEMRKGWDLILDIDCPYWMLSKAITYVFIKALKDHKIGCVTVKFSGSKGFHIAVPFEAFPASIAKFDHEKNKVMNISTKDWFPEGPRKIAAYLLDYSERELISTDHEKRIIKFGNVSMSYEKFMKLSDKSEQELMVKKCSKCRSIIKEKPAEEFEYICPHCETHLKDKYADLMMCPKCKKIMERKSSKKSLCECGSDKYYDEIDLRKIVEVDTVLISSRHLYRMPYSLHEKTGLVSMPFDIKHILKFEKDEASVVNFKPHKYLDRENAKEGEAALLFQKAFDFQPESVKKENEKTRKDFEKYKKVTTSDNITIALTDSQPIPEEFFPPCIKKISAGLEDGKKRGLFVLIAFLNNCNWKWDDIEEYIKKWNEKNYPDKLRDTYITGQIRYTKQQKEKMPCPSCSNKGYMIDTGFCNPSNPCAKMKNPVAYAKRMAWLAANNAPKKRAPRAKAVKADKNESKDEKEGEGPAKTGQGSADSKDNS